MPVYTDITKTVGNTHGDVESITEGMPGNVAVKLESRNPLYSVKDRIGVAMIEAAELRFNQTGHQISGAHQWKYGNCFAFTAAAKGLIWYSPCQRA